MRRQQIVTVVGIAALAFSFTAFSEESKPSDKRVELSLATVAHEGTDGRRYKLYEFQGEKFRVFQPNNDRVTVEGMGLTAALTVDDGAGKFRDELGGYWYQHSDPKLALDNACRRIIKRVGGPSQDDLRKELQKFYDELK